MLPEISFEFLDPHKGGDVDAVARLHETYLGGSPVVKLGARFLRAFYYRLLIEDGLIGCMFCRVGGRIVGFVSFTVFPDDFIARGVRRHFVFLGWLLLRGILVRPGLLKNVLEAVRLSLRRPGEAKAHAGPGCAEALSMATERAYRKLAPEGESRLPYRLLEEVFQHIRGQGMSNVVFLVRCDNRASNIFCRSFTHEVERAVFDGEPVNRYTYRLDGPIRLGRRRPTGRELPAHANPAGASR